MYNQDEILAKIKSIVLEEIPDGKVYLFGSRVTGKIHEESDWDILVLTEKRYPKDVRKAIDKKVFDLSILVGSDFSFLITTKDDWENHPAYYSLQLGIADQFISL